MSRESLLRRAAAPLLFFVLLGLVAGVLLATDVNSRWTASTRVVVTAASVSTDSAPERADELAPVIMRTEAALVTSSDVVRRALRVYPAMSRRSVADVVDSVSATTVDGSRVLRISYTDASAAKAKAGADAFATAYLTNRQAKAAALLLRQQTAARADVADAAKKLAIAEDVAGKKDASETQRLQATQQRSRLDAANRRLDSLDALRVTSGSVVAAARLPQASSPAKVFRLLACLALGLGLGLIAALAAVRFRRTVRSGDDLEYALGSPCLAVYRSADVGGSRGADLHRRIARGVFGDLVPPLCLAVTSPTTRSTSTAWIAAGLSDSLVRSGTPTALVQVHEPYAGVVVSDAVPTTRAAHADDLRHDDGDLVVTLERIRGERQILVVDVPGAAASADAQDIVAESDAFMLVVDGGTRTKTVHAAAAAAGSNLIGTVFVRRGRRATVADDSR